MVGRYAYGLDIILRLIFVIFSAFELSHFSVLDTIKVYIQWVPCVRNTSCSFMPIFLKLYRCFCHGLKICMWFGYNHQIIFFFIDTSYN